MITTSTPMIVPISPRFMPTSSLRAHHAAQSASGEIRRSVLGGGTLAAGERIPADGTAKFSVSTGVMRSRPTECRVSQCPRLSDLTRAGGVLAVLTLGADKEESLTVVSAARSR
jgi:hypothetical protein